MAFSQRLPQRLTPNEMARAVTSLTEQGVAITDLTQSNPTQVGLTCDPEVLARALSHADNVIYRPDPQGARRTAACPPRPRPRA